MIGSPREGAATTRKEAHRGHDQIPETTAQPLCGCECGTPTKSRFAPGHDARMVSKALAALREDRPYLGASGKVANYAAAVERVGSPALAQKFLDAVAREANRAEAKKARQGGKAKTAWQATDDVKVGRWTYPARTNGKVTQRNTKRDGSGEWVAV